MESSDFAFNKILGDTEVVIFSFLLTSPKAERVPVGFVSEFRAMSFAHRQPFFVAIPGQASQTPPNKPSTMKKKFLIMNKMT